MSDPVRASGYPVKAKHRSHHLQRVWRWVPAILTLSLLSVVSLGGPAGVAGATSLPGPEVGAAPAGEADSLTTSAAAAGLQTVPGASLSGVSCFSKDQCVAVGLARGFGGVPGTEGAVVSITDGVPGPVEAVAGTYGLNSVDCVTATTCYAVGTAPFLFPPEPETTGGVEVTIVDGAVTNVADAGAPSFGPGAPGYEYLYDIGCPSPSVCVAAGYSNVVGGFAVNVSNGEPGAPQNYLLVGPYSPSVGANGIECVTNGACLVNADNPAEGARDEAVSGFDERITIASHGKLGAGKSGGQNNTNLGRGACHDIEFCLIAGSKGPREPELTDARGVVYVAVAVTTTGDVVVPGTISLSDVSCASAYWCVAVGQSSTGEGVLVPIGWEAPAAPVPVTSTSDFSAVSCISTGLCVAVGAGENSSVVDRFRVWNGL